MSLKELMELPELKSNPLTQRVMEVFDTDSSGELDFKEFIIGMAQFSTEADNEARLKFAFRIYDLDNDGYISNGELFQVNLHGETSHLGMWSQADVLGYESSCWQQLEGYSAAAVG